MICIDKNGDRLVRFTIEGKARVLENVRFVRVVNALEQMEELGGDFFGRLAKAWLYADNGNRSKLERAFEDRIVDYAQVVEQRFWRTTEEVGKFVVA